MTTEEIKALVAEFDATYDSHKKVDAFFDQLSTFSEKDRNQIVEECSAIISSALAALMPSNQADLEELKEIFEDLQQAVDLQKSPLGAIFSAAIGFDFNQREADKELAKLLAIGQSVLHLNRLQGDAAPTTFKNYVLEAGKLSNEEYHSLAGQIKIHIQLGAKQLGADTTAPRINPFKR